MTNSWGIWKRQVLAALAAMGALCLLSTPSEAASPAIGKLAFLPLEGAPGVSQLLEEGVRDALADEGADVQAEGDTRARLQRAAVSPNCQEPACYTTLGSTLGAPYLLFAVAHEDPGGPAGTFSLRLEIRESVSGRVIAEDETVFTSDFTAPKPRAYARTKALYRSFVDKTSKPLAAGPVVQLVETKDDEPSTWKSYLPLTGVVVGVAVLAAGTTLWLIDGTVADTRQTSTGIERDYYRTATEGKALAAGGAAVFLASGALWWYARGEQPGASSKAPVVGVNLLPGGLLLAGSF
ncbi:MAG: hypothetical protein KA712_20440 [Myxococcales bacterium]|nr:hypothetical protein [Myxococcales bacterium]